MQKWKWIYISYLPTYMYLLDQSISFKEEQNFKTELKQNVHYRKINYFNFTWNV